MRLGCDVFFILISGLPRGSPASFHAFSARVAEPVGQGFVYGVSYLVSARRHLLAANVGRDHQFANPVGLEKNGSNLLSVSNNSGQPRNEANTNGLIRSTIAQGYIEGSNVNVADEMVNMIIAQRAYEMNSKAITTRDSMLDTANNLKR